MLFAFYKLFVLISIFYLTEVSVSKTEEFIK